MTPLESVSDFCRFLQILIDHRGGFLVAQGRLNRSETIRGVVGHDNSNDAMLRRSAQLLLTPENEHFEGSMHLEVKTVER